MPFEKFIIANFWQRSNSWWGHKYVLLDIQIMQERSMYFCNRSHSPISCRHQLLAVERAGKGFTKLTQDNCCWSTCKHCGVGPYAALRESVAELPNSSEWGNYNALTTNHTHHDTEWTRTFLNELTLKNLSFDWISFTSNQNHLAHISPLSSSDALFGLMSLSGHTISLTRSQFVD